MLPNDRLGHTRSFGDVGSMSGWPESGHGCAQLFRILMPSSKVRREDRALYRAAEPLYLGTIDCDRSERRVASGEGFTLLPLTDQN